MTASGVGAHATVEANARLVSSMPLTSPCAKAGSYTVVTMTSAVMVQITTVSMNGSSNATNPSLTGSGVRAVECAIAALPSPASLENTARRNPTMATPNRPPAMPSGANAPVQMAAHAAGMRAAFSPRTASAATTYSPAMAGTSFDVVLAMDLIPPTMTSPTSAASTTPMSQALSDRKATSATSRKIAVA